MNCQCCGVPCTKTFYSFGDHLCAACATWAHHFFWRYEIFGPIWVFER